MKRHDIGEPSRLVSVGTLIGVLGHNELINSDLKRYFIFFCDITSSGSLILKM